MKLIVSHKAPDVDSITSIWIFRRFDAQNFADAKLAFVNSGSTITKDEALRKGFSYDDVVHVDTGMGEFDHHQPERGKQRISAASLVYQHVIKLHPEFEKDWALQQVVEYALQQDHFETYFWPEIAKPRALFQFQGILQGLEYSGIHDDESQVAFGMQCLDGAYSSLRMWKKAQDRIEKRGIVFNTRWGKACAIETSNSEVVRVAQHSGFNVVIHKDQRQGNIRIKAVPLPEIDLSPLYHAVIKADKVGTWYFHPSKRMLLNGSRHISQRPSPLTLEQVIEMAKHA